MPPMIASGAPRPPSSAIKPGMPWAVRFAAAMLWLLAAFSFLVAGVRIAYFIDLALFSALGGWAAHQALAVARRDRSAWIACRWIAVWSAIVNALSAILLTGLIMLGYGERWRGIFAPAVETLGLFVAWASVLVIAPAALYLALSTHRVQRWFGEPI